MLSQGEIDSMLNTLDMPNDGEPGASASRTAESSAGAAARARPYDFRRPDRFSKEQLDALRTVHEAFCRSYGTTLASYTRSSVQLQLGAVEQLAYDDCVRRLPESALIGVVSLDPLPGHALCGITLEVALEVLDRLLGGSGADEREAGSELTEIERSVFRSVVVQLLDSYRDAWASVSPLQPELEEVVLGSRLARPARSGDAAALVRCELQVGERSGELAFCLPYTLLEPMIGRLGARPGAAPEAPVAAPGARAEVQRQLRNVSVEASVSLGEAALTVGELLNLRVGDVIRLDAGVADGLTLCVEGRPKYACRPGLAGRRVGVQVIRALGEDEG